MNEKILERIIQLRKELHQNAELSGHEHNTKAILLSFILEETDLEVVDRGKWFYAFYKGKGSKTVAFRADFDALPIKDREDLTYRSLNEGVSHRCGHDGHAAALAGFAAEISRKGSSMDIYFIFQFGEETGIGGEPCSELIEEKGIEEVYAFHNWSGFPEGAIALRRGTIMYASKGLTLRLTGKTAHASQPETGINPAEAFGKIIGEVGNIQRQGDYKGFLLATIVGLHIGEKNFGVAASSGELYLTLRAAYEEDLNKMQGRIVALAGRLGEDGGMKLNLEETDVFPETFNNPELVDKLENIAKKAGFQTVEIEKPIRSSEDFGHYQKKCPGVLFYVGNGENYPEIHTDGYDFNDKILERAVDMFMAIVQ